MAKKSVIGIEKAEKKEMSFRKSFETYLVFGLVVLFVGIFIGTTASAISIYNGKEDSVLDLDSTKLIESADPEEDTEVNLDELDLEEIESVQGAIQDADDTFVELFPEE